MQDPDMRLGSQALGGGWTAICGSLEALVCDCHVGERCWCVVRCVGVSGLSMDEFYGVLCWLWVAILGCNPGPAQLPSHGHSRCTLAAGTQRLAIRIVSGIT